MWLRAGEDVTSNSEVQQPDPPCPSQQRGAHSAATRSDSWGGDGTAWALAWLNLGETDGVDGRRRGQGYRHGAVKKSSYSKGVIRVGV